MSLPFSETTFDSATAASDDDYISSATSYFTIGSDAERDRMLRIERALKQLEQRQEVLLAKIANGGSGDSASRNWKRDTPPSASSVRSAKRELEDLKLMLAEIRDMRLSTMAV